MNYTEAIDYFKRRKIQYGLADNVQQAENCAVEALEKQIPKSPILDIIYPSGIRSYKCPVCGKGCLVRTNLYYPKYCSNCGQALDWSYIE